MADAGTLTLDPVLPTITEAPPAPPAPTQAAVSPSSRAVLAAAALIVVAGAAIRFAALSTSIWFDEAVSVRDVSGSFGQMLHRVINHEASPPFYFICLWIWRHLVGGTAVDLRALSAVSGTLTIALAFYVAQRRVGPRAGLLLAICVAVSPSLFYFSTEMRMYGLLILITGVSFEAFLRASDSPNRSNLSLWAATSILAVWTQYFAALLIVPEASLLALLAWRNRPGSRATILAVGGVGIAGAPLIYLMLYQARHAFAYGSGLLSSAWQHSPLSIHTYPSLSGVAEEVVLGPAGPARGLVTSLVCLIAIAAVVYLRRRGRTTVRQLAWVCCLLGPAAFVVEALVVLHVQVSGRYLLPLWLPIGLGAGYVVSAGRFGVGLVGVLVCLWLAVLLISVTVPRYAAQDDTLGAARSLGVASRDRLIAISQSWDVTAFEDYRPQASPPASAVVRVRELDVVAMPVAGEPPPGDHQRPSSPGLGPLPRGLRLTGVVRGSTFLIERFVARTPVAVQIDGRGSTFAGYWRFLREPAGARMGSL